MRLKNIVSLLVTVIILVSSFAVSSFASYPTDEIIDFTITVDVNEDASLNMKYHIEWKVLDDETYGPLSWVDLGLPNGEHWDIRALSDTIESIEENYGNVNIYLDRDYYAGETVSFDFSFVQDNMYQIDKYTPGETVYSFTPAWFDDFDVDSLSVRWKKDSANSWQPDCFIEGDYLVFNASLKAGDRYTLSVYYNNDSFGFSSERSADSYSGGYGNYTDSYDAGDIIAIIIAMIILCLPILVFVLGIILAIIAPLKEGSNFNSGSGETVKKITRTKIEYYENCPGCGAAHEEGYDDCKYCGHSMIKSKEVVTEDQIEHPENYSTNGTFRYSGSPNTFIHVNVVNVPAPRPVRSSCVTSSCVHSSCAHSSCACASHCACACACASSGRAGCSVKNFFNKDRHNSRVRIDSGNHKTDSCGITDEKTKSNRLI